MSIDQSFFRPRAAKVENLQPVIIDLVTGGSVFTRLRVNIQKYKEAILLKNSDRLKELLLIKSGFIKLQKQEIGDFIEPNRVQVEETKMRRSLFILIESIQNVSIKYSP